MVQLNHQLFQRMYTESWNHSVDMLLSSRLILLMCQNHVQRNQIRLYTRQMRHNLLLDLMVVDGLRNSVVDLEAIPVFLKEFFVKFIFHLQIFIDFLPELF